MMAEFTVMGSMADTTTLKTGMVASTGRKIDITISSVAVPSFRYGNWSDSIRGSLGMQKKLIMMISLISVITLMSSCGNTSDTANTNEANSGTVTTEVLDSISSEVTVDNTNNENVNDNQLSENDTSITPFYDTFKRMEYLPLDDKFLLENNDGIKYVVDKEGNIKYLADADVVTPKLSFNWNDKTISDIYGNDVTDKYVKEENQIALGVVNYDNDQVVWVLQREEGFSESYVKYLGYTSDGEKLIEFDSKEYPEILFESLFENGFSSGYPVYKGNHIFALRKPYTGMGNYITTDGEDLTEFNYYLNVDTKTIFSLDGVSRGGCDNIFDNYAFYWDKLYDLNGNIVKEYDTKMWYLGEGKVMNADDSWVATESRYIYDMVTGEKLIDLSEYQYSLQWVDKFADGYILIDIENDQGHDYLGVMNENGEWAIEPYKATGSTDGATVGKVGNNKVLLKGTVYDLDTGNMIADPVKGANPVRIDNKAYYLSKGILTVYDYETETDSEIDLYLN